MRLDFRIRLTSDVQAIRTQFNNIPDGYKTRSIRRFGLDRAAETCIRTFLVLRIANQSLFTAFLKINGDPFYNPR